MGKSIAEHILFKLKYPELMHVLTSQLNGSALNSVLLEVFNKRVEKQLPADLLKLYAGNRLVKPADVDVIKLKEQELSVLRLFSDLGFVPIELSAAAQFGTCAVVGTTDQKKVLTALRNTELQADPTNAIALHYAWLKKTNAIKGKINKFSSVTRLLRPPLSKITGHTPHFSMGCLVTGGLDTGNFEFEKTALADHLSTHHKLLKDVYGLNEISFSIIPLKGYDQGDALVASCAGYLHTQRPELSIAIAHKNDNQHFYKGFQVKTHIHINGQTIDIGDGGLVDWTQQLLGNKKERLFTSGIGVQHLHHLTS